MDQLLLTLTVLAALGSGLIAGVFFAFSVSVMAALGRQPPAAGISAMQAINVVIVNPLFLGAFMGTALIGVVLAIAAVMRWSYPGAAYLLAGGVLYVAGCFLLTMVCNVPLNNRLAAIRPDSVEGANFWRRYLVEWTNWNHARTAASFAAAACFIMALL